MNIEHIAKIVHDANKSYCETIGDFTQKRWEEADQWQKDSAIKGVAAVVQDPSITPRFLHEAWCTDKLAHGWVYGDEKDADKKTHPCLVPYDQLPAEQQLKDSLFSVIARTLMSNKND